MQKNDNRFKILKIKVNKKEREKKGKLPRSAEAQRRGRGLYQQ